MLTEMVIYFTFGKMIDNSGKNLAALSSIQRSRRVNLTPPKESLGPALSYVCALDNTPSIFGIVMWTELRAVCPRSS